MDFGSFQLFSRFSLPLVTTTPTSYDKTPELFTKLSHPELFFSSKPMAKVTKDPPSHPKMKMVSADHLCSVKYIHNQGNYPKSPQNRPKQGL